MDLKGKDVFLITLIIIIIGVALFSNHYRIVLNDMVGIIVALMVPIFMIILALSIFAGPKVLSFIAMPGVKPLFAIMIIFIIFGGFSATLGNDLNTQLTGNSVKATDVIFTKETLNVSIIMLVGVFLFFMVLTKSH